MRRLELTDGQVELIEQLLEEEMEREYKAKSNCPSYYEDVFKAYRSICVQGTFDRRAKSAVEDFERKLKELKETD